MNLQNEALTATEVTGQVQYNMDPEERSRRYRQLINCLQEYNEMRTKIFMCAPHPGFSVDIKTREIVPLPYPKNILDLLAKIKELEGMFVKFNFPEFYKPENYETEKQF